MLATFAPMQQTPNPDYTHYPWTPTRPSPLSPQRSSSSPTMITTASIQQPQLQQQSQTHSPLFTFYPSPTSSPSRGLPETTSNAKATTSPSYAARYTTTISRPLLSHSAKRTFTASSTSAARFARRNAFLDRVKQDRNDGRFEARAEQLAFMEDIVEQKEWNERMKRGAEEVEAGLPWESGVEDEEGMYSEDAEVQALDEYLEQEHALEMQLLEQMHPAQDSTRGNPASSFSDDEYDDIFMDLADPSAPQDIDMSG
ncbi:hypothetical protein BJY01DRAFT_38117 [Aspergillus pseudoustus]|uniref:Uncharacterized protein n=1 Tax=Aspergillus pseudoustus TaxID=1810923 RepID=A0ABR4KQ63_9EURO